MRATVASNIAATPRPTISLDRHAGTIDIFGGASGYTQQSPYHIGFSLVRTTADVSEWLCQLAGKTWFPPSSLWALRRTLLGIREEWRR